MEYYDRVNKRLVYYGTKADADFWERHWASVDIKAISAEKNDKLTLSALKRYMPDKKGIVLECGCGLATKVYCMDSHGYETIGIDLSFKTLESVKKEAGDLRLIAGDIIRLPIKSSSITVCMLLGVIEHYEEGCGSVIREIHRALKQGGYLLVTFPVINLLRRFKIHMGLYKEASGLENKCFYQYAFNAKDIKEIFLGTGFKILEGHNTGGIKGLKDELDILRALLQSLFDYRPRHFLARAFKQFLESILCPFCGHMRLLILQKQ